MTNDKEPILIKSDRVTEIFDDCLPTDEEVECDDHDMLIKHGVVVQGIAGTMFCLHSE